jgi:hypothetical protein
MHMCQAGKRAGGGWGGYPDLLERSGHARGTETADTAWAGRCPRSTSTCPQSCRHQASKGLCNSTRSYPAGPRPASRTTSSVRPGSAFPAGRTADSATRLARLGSSWKFQAVSWRSRWKTMSVRPRSHAQSRRTLRSEGVWGQRLCAIFPIVGPVPGRRHLATDQFCRDGYRVCLAALRRGTSSCGTPAAPLRRCRRDSARSSEQL